MNKVAAHGAETLVQSMAGFIEKTFDLCTM